MVPCIGTSTISSPERFNCVFDVCKSLMRELIIN